MMVASPYLGIDTPESFQYLPLQGRDIPADNSLLIAASEGYAIAQLLLALAFAGLGDTEPAKIIGSCGTRPIGKRDIAIIDSSNGEQFLIGVKRCRRNLCPNCGALEAARRYKAWKRQADKIDQDHNADIEHYFVTLTAPHCTNDDLRAIYNALIGAFRSLQTRRQWQRAVIGFARAFDVTHGEETGFHPHLHAIITINSTSAVEFLNWLKASWASQLLKRLGVRPLPDIGIQFREIDAANIGSEIHYLTKAKAIAEPALKVGEVESTQASPWHIAPAAFVQLWESLKGAKLYGDAGAWRTKKEPPTKTAYKSAATITNGDWQDKLEAGDKHLAVAFIKDRHTNLDTIKQGMAGLVA